MSILEPSQLPCSTAAKRLGQVFVLFREILFTLMNWKYELGCITIHHIHSRHAFFCLVMFSKKFMLSYHQTLRDMLLWEVSAFLVEPRQSYGSFKFKAFIQEITTRPRLPRFHVLARIQKPVTSRQMRI